MDILCKIYEVNGLMLSLFDIFILIFALFYLIDKLFFRRKEYFKICTCLRKENHGGRDNQGVNPAIPNETQKRTSSK